MSDSLSNEQYSDIENRILSRKGFKLRYEFSNQYADLSFITGSHITGTSKMMIHIKFIFQVKIIFFCNF